MSNNPVLVVKELNKSYGRVQALRGVDLQVEQGALYGFLGPNGAGKTTTIRCMLDLIRPQSGSIRIMGMDPQQDPVGVRARTGYLPGELSLEANLQVGKVLRYFCDLRGDSTDWDFVLQLTNRLDLDLDMPIKNLSKGNKQKIGVVQALMSRPEVLLLDEPTAGLDPLMQQEVYRLLREAQADGTTIFFSSHIISEVEALADRVAIIRKGVIVEEAEPSKLVNIAMRRVKVRFSHIVDPDPLARVEGVSLLSRSNGTGVTLQVEGEMDNLVKALAAFPVRDLETEHPSLEEVFLAYYEADKKEVN